MDEETTVNDISQNDSQRPGRFAQGFALSPTPTAERTPRKEHPNDVIRLILFV
jgi:hypothetical protein